MGCLENNCGVLRLCWLRLGWSKFTIDPCALGSSTLQLIRPPTLGTVHFSALHLLHIGDTLLYARLPVGVQVTVGERHQPPAHGE